MVTGIVIAHETNVALRKVEFQTFTDYQKAVGGYVEIVKLEGHSLAIVADEDGKVKGLPINRRATILWWLLNPKVIGGDHMVGDVVLLGAERRGEMTDVTDDFMALLLSTKHYQVKVLLSRTFDTWVPIGFPVSNFFEAAIRALRLIEVWEPATDVKVVPAS
jgi:hypothetical protein